MARNPDSEVGTVADPSRVRSLLIEIGALKPLELSDAETALVALDDFPDTDEGRRQFADAMRALTGR